MLRALAISNYRSLRELVTPLGRLTVVQGPNGVGKSNLYRALRLLQETALGNAVSSLAREGGLESVLWAGPEELGRNVKRGKYPVQGTVRKNPIRLRLGFADEDFSYSVEFGLPTPVPGTMFCKDPEIKREVIWHGEECAPGAALVDRKGPLLRARNHAGRWETITDELGVFESMMMTGADAQRAPAAFVVRERLRSWRFYDGFRADADAPARQSQVGTRTPVLSNDGRDLAAALQTIREIGDAVALDRAVDDAFPGARVEVTGDGARFDVQFYQHGLLRPLSQAELSDGTLRFLLWVAALLTPRPPALMVLNEPETSLHPDLLPALGRLISVASERTQVWVVTHSVQIQTSLEESDEVQPLQLEKRMGETTLAGVRLLDVPAWSWPSRS